MQQFSGHPNTLSLEDQLEQQEKFEKNLRAFEYATTYTTNKDAFSMHMLAGLVDIGVLKEIETGVILTSIGRHEMYRLRLVIKDLQARIAEADVAREAEDFNGDDAQPMGSPTADARGEHDLSL